MAHPGNQSLIERIRALMEQCGGAIPFAQYMNMCLYDEKDGYYTKEAAKVGKDGDFYTSAYVGTAMGWAIASFIAEAAEAALSGGGAFTVMEWGGGDGRLAKAVLDTLAEQYPQTYERLTFVSVDTSAYHRMLQSDALDAYRGKVEAIVSPADPAVGEALSRGFTVLYANELLDAFPVHRLRKEGGEVKEIYVSWNEERGAFAEITGPVSDVRIVDMLDRLSVRLQEGQTAELNLGATEWIRNLGSAVVRGAVALIDYGDVSSELYASHRMEGTLVCYRKHAAHGDPYVWVGEQDMTAHVDFGLCRLSALEAGFTDVELRTQKQFLVERGILNRLQPHAGTDPFSPEARNNRAIRQLLLSDGMSELFKVMTMRKG
ncbi:class I SAM-dependent methyltransferase [Paenibacillus alkalitolerans]|uniref:class I SAM-dependent methyltransferase n=1 Tax=Paenibacillus alkalitolerans TaxID=2799335 RepID=UPI0018F44BDC|nr:SAM-dependent methyltransferase [Paenibacillus alkalitolerans]